MLPDLQRLIALQELDLRAGHASQVMAAAPGRIAALDAKLSEGRAMSKDRTPRYDFSLTPLDPEDQQIAEAYAVVGRSVDDLPYTADFDRLVGLLGRPGTDDVRRHVFRRLLALRKRSRLPGSDRGGTTLSAARSPSSSAPSPSSSSGRARS